MLAPTISQEEELHWLALRLIPGLGTRKAGQLLERFRTPMAVFRASRSELEAAGIVGGLAQSVASQIADGEKLRMISEDIKLRLL